jgi:hypothetical protein
MSDQEKPSPASELHTMIERGPLSDIFRADESRGIVEIIGVNANAINASTYAPMFVALRSYGVEQFVMAMTRLFDQPKKQYQLRSLPAIIEYVADASDVSGSREIARLLSRRRPRRERSCARNAEFGH